MEVGGESFRGRVYVVVSQSTLSMMILRRLHRKRATTTPLAQSSRQANSDAASQRQKCTPMVNVAVDLLLLLSPPFETGANTHNINNLRQRYRPWASQKTPGTAQGHCTRTLNTAKQRTYSRSRNTKHAPRETKDRTETKRRQPTAQQRRR